MVSKTTLQRYIKRLDEVIAAGDTSTAKDLQDEIIASLGSDLDGLKRGLTNYSFIGAFKNGRTGKTTVVADDIDFIKDVRTLRSRLQVELEKIEDSNMISMPSAFLTETLVLHKKDGTTVEVTALVDSNKIHSDDVAVVIEEGDIFERTLPNGAKEYFRVTDRGLYKGDHGVPDNYQSKVVKISRDVAEHWCLTPLNFYKRINMY